MLHGLGQGLPTGEVRRIGRQLKRHLGVCYRTAWLIKHPLLQVMVEREANRGLAGRIESDDADLGGECPGTPGRGSANQVPLVIAVETNAQGHPRFVELSPTPFTKTALAAWSEASR